MSQLAKALVLFVIALHVAFAVAEMIFWQHPVVMARFGNTPEFARASAVLAANQGLYNALFAAALAWALFSRQHMTVLVLLACLTVAGLFGGLTAKFTIIFVQALPAAAAFALYWSWTRSSLQR
jgi:putative membrane protein